MFKWYKDLSVKETRTFWGCFAGWALDGMDIQLYSFLIPTLIAVWGISTADAGLIGTATLVSSAFGGWVAGILCDRYGRLRVLQLTILWYSFFTFVSGFTDSFEQLLVVRCLQGIGFGGEWTAGAVLLGEVIRASHRGRAVGCVQSGHAIGWGCATIASSIMLALLPQEIAWRAVFWIGVTPAILVIYVRRNMTESEIFLSACGQRAQSRGISPLAIFSPSILRTTLLASLLAMGIQGSSYAIITWLPTFLKTAHNLSTVGTGGYVLVVTLGSFCGFLASAHLSDAIGRRRNFLVYAIGCWVIDYTFMYLPISDRYAIFLGFPFGFFTQGIYASLGPFFTELFPTRMRATGQGFAYNFGRGVGAFLTFFVGVMAKTMPLGDAIAILSLAGYLLAIVATLLLPETRGKELTDSAVDSPDPTSAASAEAANAIATATLVQRRR